MPGHLDAYGNLVFHRHGEKGGRIDFEVGERRGKGSGDVGLGAVFRELKGDLLVVRGLASELNFKIGVDGGGVARGFG